MAATLTRVIDAPTELGFFAIFGGLRERWGLPAEQCAAIDARLRDALDDERSERFSSQTEPALSFHCQTWHRIGWPYRTDHQRVELETLAKTPEGLRLRVVWDVEDCDGIMHSEELLQVEVSASGDNAEAQIQAFESWLASLRDPPRPRADH